MKIVAQVPHPACAITVYAWNGKYLVKFEQDLLEQTYKLREMDTTGEADVHALVADEVFIAEVMERFAQMRASLYGVMDRVL